MTAGWLIMILLPLAGPLPTRDVTVYFAAEGTASVAGTRRVATAALGKAGVTVVWRASGLRGSDVPPAWLKIELVDGPSDMQPPGALAVSYPRAGCTKGITVFLDAVRALAGDANRESALLGYVLAHEIAHVIEGVNRHSRTGVMKACWNEADRAAIFQGRLGFEDLDVQLMRNGLSRGWCAEGAALRDRSGPGTVVHPE